MQVTTRILTADWLLTTNILGLNDTQRYLMLVLPNLAESNGCFESSPDKICYLTSTKLTDLELLFKILVNEGLLESYEYQGKKYWYLTQFLEGQRLRVKSQIPSPPWVEWQPEKGAINQGHTSQGRYIDKRKQQLLLTTEGSIDNKFTLEYEENKNKNMKENKGVNILSRDKTEEEKDEIIAKLFVEIVDEVEKLALDYKTQLSYIAMGMTHKTRQAGVNDRLELYKYTKKDRWILEKMPVNNSFITLP